MVAVDRLAANGSMAQYGAEVSAAVGGITTPRFAAQDPAKPRSVQDHVWTAPMAEASRLLYPKSVAARDVACLQTSHEPTRALCRCAMGERVRNYITLRLPLQSIIADRRSGLHCGFHVPVNCHFS